MRCIEREATEEEMDAIGVDVWSYRTNADGLMEETGRETISLREACRRSGMKPLVYAYESEWIDIPVKFIQQRTGDEPV